MIRRNGKLRGMIASLPLPHVHTAGQHRVDTRAVVAHQRRANQEAIDNILMELREKLENTLDREVHEMVDLRVHIVPAGVNRYEILSGRVTQVR